MKGNYSMSITSMEFYVEFDQKIFDLNKINQNLPSFGNFIVTDYDANEFNFDFESSTIEIVDEKTLFVELTKLDKDYVKESNDHMSLDISEINEFKEFNMFIDTSVNTSVTITELVIHGTENLKIDDFLSETIYGQVSFDMVENVIISN